MEGSGFRAFRRVLYGPPKGGSLRFKCGGFEVSGFGSPLAGGTVHNFNAMPKHQAKGGGQGGGRVEE